MGCSASTFKYCFSVALSMADGLGTFCVFLCFKGCFLTVFSLLSFSKEGLPWRRALGSLICFLGNHRDLAYQDSISSIPVDQSLCHLSAWLQILDLWTSTREGTICLGCWEDVRHLPDPEMCSSSKAYVIAWDIEARPHTYSKLLNLFQGLPDALQSSESSVMLLQTDVKCNRIKEMLTCFFVEYIEELMCIEKEDLTPKIMLGAIRKHTKVIVQYGASN